MKIVVINLISILVLTSNLFSQGIPYGQEFQVNTYSIGHQVAPSVETLSNGNFIVCWCCWVPDEGYDIYGQIFDSLCLKLGDEFQVNTYSTSSQINQEIAKLADNGFVVCWQSDGQDGDGWGLYGQIFDSSGAKVGDEFQVNAQAEGSQHNLAIAGLVNGGFVVCWESSIPRSSKSIICVQIFDEKGKKIGPESKIQGNSQRYLSVCELKGGRFVVCWKGDNEIFDDYNIYGQIFEPSGEKSGNYFRVNTLTKRLLNSPHIVALEDGGFVVCWESYTTDENNFDIFCQFFDAMGKKRGDEIQVNTYLNDAQWVPKVASQINGSVAVLWASRGQDGSKWGIYGQLFDRTGSKISHEFRVNDYTSGDQYGPVVKKFLNHYFIAIWSSENQDGFDRGIFGKYFPAEPIIHQLQQFSLVDPANDATLNTTRVLFCWTQPSNIKEFIPWEITFDLYIDTDSNFPHPQIIRNIQDTTYTIDSLAAGKTYFWKVLAKNLAGDSLWSKQQDWGFFIKYGATLVDNAENELPQHFELYQNYPNPFNSSTTIKYQLPEATSVKLDIYNLLGQRLRTLVDQFQMPGSYSINWDGTDDFKQLVTSGVYLYQLRAKNLSMTNKLILLR